MLGAIYFKRILLLSLATSFLPLAAVSQTSSENGKTYSSSSSATPLPQAPSTHVAASATQKARSPFEYSGYGGDLRMHAACGGGLDLVRGSSQGALALCGAGFTFIPFTATEFGGVRLQDGSAHFYLSEDFIAPITPVLKRLRGDPIGIVGYTKIVGNSNRFDYGVGWEQHIKGMTSVGLEIRDYMQFTSPVQHAVVLRLVLVTGGPDT